MRAATIRDGGIRVEEHPDPEPGAGELLVRVRAAGLNASVYREVGNALAGFAADERALPLAA